MNEDIKYPPAGCSPHPVAPLPNLAVLDSIANDAGSRARVLTQELTQLVQFLAGTDRTSTSCAKLAADTPPGRIALMCSSLLETSADLFTCLSLVKSLKEVLSAPDQAPVSPAGKIRQY